ncbi:hypothetical protein BDU57DRAFT_553550 [Ampelomyces quisqualis]|uniref:Uncharacterized protein n=1 Tax=Ampelomyces quisqualis TaxID=50730 RepID=A0A6A5R150_AMPQU|nr:hypothetical protein BDU57DRAFT_553550 [Ampelomyces quisqualis]
MSGHMHTSQLPRRASRSFGNQQLCRPCRVEKPKSHHNSPRMTERRKTTTESKLYATLDDHYRMMFGVEPEEADDERPQIHRPMSWHPSSAQFQAQHASSYFEPQHNWHSPSPRNSVQGSDFYSLSTRNSLYEPTCNHASYTGAYGESEYSWQDASHQTPSYVHSSTNTPSTEPLPWYLQKWAQQNHDQAMMRSHNASLDFLPMQHPATQDEEMEDQSGEKLVALGLYDLPEPSLTWGGREQATGKGLKLEETWQPPVEEDEEGEEEEEAEDAADDASSVASEEPSPPLPSVNDRTRQLQLPVHMKTHTPGSMDGQTFFFDDDETVSKEWWFHQVKQPSMPGRDNGLGYGWL